MPVGPYPVVALFSPSRGAGGDSGKDPQKPPFSRRLIFLPFGSESEEQGERPGCRLLEEGSLFYVVVLLAGFQVNLTSIKLY